MKQTEPIWAYVDIPFHTEQIICPECDCINTAKVEHMWPFGSYVHTCVNCGYIIMESEWNRVEPIINP